DDAADLGADEWVDADGDNLSDYWELRYFTTLSNASAQQDVDGVGLIKLHEYLIGTDPSAAQDADSNGLFDDYEIWLNAPDANNNGLPDVHDAYSASIDTDGDGMQDFYDPNPEQADCFIFVTNTVTLPDWEESVEPGTGTRVLKKSWDFDPQLPTNAVKIHSVKLSGTVDDDFAIDDTVFCGSFGGETFSGLDVTESIQDRTHGTFTLKLYDHLQEGYSPNGVSFHGTAEYVWAFVIKVEIDVDSSDAQNTCELDIENGREQFATVKGTGNVILKADIQPDTPAVRALIDWQGAIEDPSDPTKATISRTSSKKQQVSVLVNGSTCAEANVWVVWAEIDQMIASDPPGTPSDSDVSPTTHTCNSDYFAYGLYDGAPEHFQNGILVGAKIYPSAFSNRFDQVNYNFVRTKESVTWIEVDNFGWAKDSYYSPGTSDGPNDCSQDQIPSELDNVYDVDGPGRNGMASVWENWVYQGTFDQWLEIELPGLVYKKVSDTAYWHAELWIKRHWLTGDYYRNSTGNTVGSGSIIINSTTHP
ncbi:MAG: hypothetical protein PHG65_06750, partial [Kiritimatiellae bacterium]|nr:hypothetical protein [Kiritimatiellia bacterium]